MCTQTCICIEWIQQHNQLYWGNFSMLCYSNFFTHVGHVYVYKDILVYIMISITDLQMYNVKLSNK